MRRRVSVFLFMCIKHSEKDAVSATDLGACIKKRKKVHLDFYHAEAVIE